MPVESAPPLPINAPTAVLKARRNQTFMTSSRSCEPTIRHQERNTLLVDFEAPMQKASGEV